VAGDELAEPNSCWLLDPIRREWQLLPVLPIFNRIFNGKWWGAGNIEASPVQRRVLAVVFWRRTS